MDEDKLFEIVRNAYNGINTDYLKSQVLAAVAKIGLTRQEVMEGLLDWIVVGGCTGMNDRYRLYIYGALALLKEQEARVMTEGEVLHSTGKPIWFESCGMYLSKKGFWILPFEVDPELHIRFVQSVTGGKITLSLIDYGKLWRAWTSRPREQQMRDTKWEDTGNG